MTIQDDFFYIAELWQKFRNRWESFLSPVFVTGGTVRIDPDQTLSVETRVGETVDVFIQDQTTPIIDLLMIQNLAAVTLAAPVVIDDTAVTMVAGHGFVAGQILNLREGIRSYQSQVTNVAVNVLTMDSPLDFAFTVAAAGIRGNANMNVNGSLAVPITFFIVPPVNVEWDVVRIIGNIQDDNSMDTGTFGGIAALTNGILLRVANTSFFNVFNVKSNGEIAERMFDVAYDDRAPAGTFGFRFRRTFGGNNKNGVVIRLDGVPMDQLQILVQDDLTAITTFRVVVQGHVVED